MAKKRSRRNKKKKRIRFHRSFFLPFLLTLTAAVALGVLALAAHQWIMEPVKTKKTDIVQSNREKAPPQADSAVAEGNGTETAGDETEAAGTEKETETETVSKYQEELDDPAYMEENNIYTVEPAEAGRVTMAFAGDILFDANYAIMGAVGSGGDISKGITPEVMERMQAADIMMLNNEFAYSNRGAPIEEKQFTFRAKPETAAYLTDLGVDLVSLANNHAYDYGPTALEDTLDTLRETGIPYVGAGRNIGEARRPVYYIVGDIKIAFVSATQIERLDTPDTKEATETSPGVFRCWNGAKFLETIREAAQNSDFVVAYVHWGTENQVELDWAQLKQAPELIEAGADLVIGDHPHCLQPIGVIGGVPVIYSLGNFWFNSKTLDTCMVEVVIDETGIVSYQFIPCLQSGCRTTLLQDAEKERVLSYMRGISEGVRIDEEGFVSW
ncbi:MAG: CapA family protein [Lachnospiraceae bacterium]|nr:CapA family protein [Lachnospiraceae bacterium]